MAEFDKVAILGVGLIGGSIGLALRERKLAKEVVGIGRRESALAMAQKLGAIDRSTTSLAQGVADAEIVVVATPVDTVAEFTLKVAEVCPPRTTITDAGSTKETIVAAVERGLTGRRDGPWFIGSHPIAGDHRTGVEFARAELFDGRKTVVTPTAHSHRASTLDVERFWRSLGADVVTMSPAEHDAALAATSHLPHLVAYALAFATPNELLPLAASGWRDTTRIAGSDPNLWRPIFAANRVHVLEALDRFTEVVALVRESLETGDDQELYGILERAQRTKSHRDALGD
jgi:prephenate dehydrogenase